MHAEEWIAQHGNRLRKIAADRLRRNLLRQKGSCTWCGQQVPKGRRSWCSQTCVDAFMCRQPSTARGIVTQRDRGICQQCGRDTGRIKSLLYRLRYQGGYVAQSPAWPEAYKCYEQLLLGLGFNAPHGQLWRAELFEVDHIVPVADGGGLCTPAGLATLCVPCHKMKTREFNRELARRRRSGAR